MIPKRNERSELIHFVGGWSLAAPTARPCNLARSSALASGTTLDPNERRESMVSYPAALPRNRESLERLRVQGSALGYDTIHSYSAAQFV